MLVTGRKIKSYCFLTLILCGLIKGVRYLKPISCEKHIHVERVIVARLEIETLKERFGITNGMQGRELGSVQKTARSRAIEGEEIAHLV